MNTSERLTYKKYLAQVWPNMLAHLATPLLKVIEIAVIGRFLNPIYMASLGISITVLTTIDWLISFFRAGVIAESGSAYQKENKKLQASVLAEYIAIVVMFMGILILTKEFLWDLIMLIYRPDVEVGIKAKQFWDIAIWGLPISLINYMIMGWFFGRDKAKNAVFLELGTTIINILLCLLFINRIVFTDIAVIYVITQIIILVIGIGLLFKEDREILGYMKDLSLWVPRNIPERIKSQIGVIQRATCSVIVNNIVIITGSYMGTKVLAANFIIMQLKDLIAYLFEGISTTIRGMVASGKFNEDKSNLKEVHKMTLQTVMYLSIGLVIFYAMARRGIINHLINIEEIQKTLISFDGWLVLYPIIAGWGLSAYGLYVGLTQEKFIANSTVIGFIVFLITYIIAVRGLGNHGVWFAFVMFYLVRSIMLLGYEGYLYE
ncbi:MAG: hypothetical protein J6F30_14525 [Cellulosilyticum sp.]|nr:hypothetical protein [Cellulosilyticum sp.]